MTTALIAEDEPLLAAVLRSELARLWPDLDIVATAGDGVSALAQALALSPDILFFDVRMPGMSGLEAAAELADRWDISRGPFLALVFVTAYDQYAVAAFEAQAVDYLLKPVQTARLQKTVNALRERLRNRATSESPLDTTLAQLRTLLAPPPAVPTPRITLLQAGVGNQIHMVAVADVLYFEAADKYVRVVTAQHEYLVRTPLKELVSGLDPAEFWQVHRGTLVRASAIERISRDDNGRLRLHLRHRSETLAVSRLYAHLFKAQ